MVFRMCNVKIRMDLAHKYSITVAVILVFRLFACLFSNWMSKTYLKLKTTQLTIPYIYTIVYIYNKYSNKRSFKAISKTQPIYTTPFAHSFSSLLLYSSLLFTNSITHCCQSWLFSLPKHLSWPAPYAYFYL